MKRCLDEGTLQAYLDGELSHEAARETAAHIASCAECAETLAVAGDETAFFASAFAPDANLSVPTAELRARVNAAVARLETSTEVDSPKTTGWNFSSFTAAFSALFTLTPQRAAAFAGVAALMVMAAVFLFQRPDNNNNNEIASGDKPRTKATPVSAKPEATPMASPSPAPTNATTTTGGEKSRGGAKSGGASRRKAAPFTPVPAPRLDEKFLPGEREYQTTIATLDKTIKAGDAVLKPKVISIYERNVAVLDRAIEESRRVALRNPKDKEAVSFLMSAYQSKVELMTTVADNAQVATLDR